MKNLSELRAMSSNELQEELMSLRKAQFNQRLKRSSGTLDKTHLVKQTRRMIAKVKTIIMEKAD